MTFLCEVFRLTHIYLSFLERLAAALGINQPDLIVLLGPPGAGKGTLWKNFSKFLHGEYTYFSLGELFRQAIDADTELGRKVKPFVDSGGLVPDELVINMVMDKLCSTTDCVVGDGIIRTKEQADALIKACTAKHFTVKVIVVTLDFDEIIRRVGDRLICPSCQATYTKSNFNPPPTPGYCQCGCALTQRADDAKIHNRLELYKRETIPALKHLRAMNIPVRTVNNAVSFFAQLKFAWGIIF